MSELVYKVRRQRRMNPYPSGSIGWSYGAKCIWWTETTNGWTDVPHRASLYDRDDAHAVARALRKLATIEGDAENVVVVVKSVVRAR